MAASMPAPALQRPPARWPRRVAADAAAYAALATVLTLLQTTMLGLRGASVVLIVFTFNALVSVLIGTTIDVGQAAASRLLALERRGAIARLVVHVAVVGLAVIVGVESAVALIAVVSPRVAEVFPRAGVLWVAVPVTVVMVAIGSERARMHARTAEAERDAEVGKRQALRAELSALQSRTNPHFLFNALNTIAALIGEDPRTAERAVERLAALLRFTLDSGQRPAVRLADELAATLGYVELERLRFGDRLRMQVDVDEALLELPVPPMSLQPLVENAVLHAVAARRGPTTIELWARRSGAAVELGVRDDGPGDGQHHGTGTAQAGLRARLRLLHGASAGLEAGPRPGGGYQVILRLPEPGS